MSSDIFERMRLSDWFLSLEHLSEDHYYGLYSLYERMLEKGHCIEAIRIVMGEELQ